MNVPPVDWLLEGPPYVQYGTYVDLLGKPLDAPEVQASKQKMLEQPEVQSLLVELNQWPGRVIKTHKDAGHPLHKLAFLADLGLRITEPAVADIVAHIQEHPSAEGPYSVLVNIPVHFHGSGQDQWTWFLCDAPLVLYALVKFGLAEDDQVQKAVQFLCQLVHGNGWPCAVSAEMAGFRGPGRKENPCPYANLLMLQLLAQRPDWRDSEAAHVGAETQLTLWEQSKEQHPYLFHMGNDFRKLKAPLVWYDILHVVDVLTQYPWLQQDRRLLEMAGLIAAKGDGEGRFTPESVWQAWAGWDFGQKKQPSRWLTLVAQRALRRLQMV